MSYEIYAFLGEVARACLKRAQATQPALVNGAARAVAVAEGQLFAVLGFTVRRGKIVEIDVVADPRTSARST